MKVYEFYGFPNSARVRIALGEKGRTDKGEFVNVNVFEGEHKTPEFLEKNLSAVVPVLELEDGMTISECATITEYLDDVEGEPSLTERTPKDRAIIHMMQRRAESGLLNAVMIYFHHTTPGLGPKIESDKCTESSNHQNNALSRVCAILTVCFPTNLISQEQSFRWRT
ncbi:MAG: glutathione S-transferase family protein [Hyphomicrobiaceae bacterium]